MILTNVRLVKNIINYVFTNLAETRFNKLISDLIALLTRLPTVFFFTLFFY